MYCNLISNFPINNYCLAEQPKTYMPIIANFTLKFHPSDNFILAVVHCYQQAMLNVLNIAESHVKLICCVLKSNDYIENNLIVSRFRLQFPYCKTLPYIQRYLLHPYVLNLLRTENVKTRLNVEPVNDWDDIIDPYSVEQPCIMYGSSISSIIPKYQLEYIFYIIERDNIDNENVYTLDLNQVFLPGNHEIVLNDNENKLFWPALFSNKDLKFWLPMFLSVSYYNEITTSSQIISTTPEIISSTPEIISTTPEIISSTPEIISIAPEIISTTPEIISIAPEIISSTPIIISITSEMIMAGYFIVMLGRHRAELNHFWLDVGKVLYNTYEGSNRVSNYGFNSHNRYRHVILKNAKNYIQNLNLEII